MESYFDISSMRRNTHLLGVPTSRQVSTDDIIQTVHDYLTTDNNVFGVNDTAAIVYVQGKYSQLAAVDIRSAIDNDIASSNPSLVRLLHANGPIASEYRVMRVLNGYANVGTSLIR